jgi:hypothetical protein
MLWPSHAAQAGAPAKANQPCGRPRAGPRRGARARGAGAAAPRRPRARARAGQTGCCRRPTRRPTRPAAACARSPRPPRSPPQAAAPPAGPAERSRYTAVTHSFIHSRLDVGQVVRCCCHTLPGAWAPVRARRQRALARCADSLSTFICLQRAGRPADLSRADRVRAAQAQTSRCKRLSAGQQARADIHTRVIRTTSRTKT